MLRTFSLFILIMLVAISVSGQTKGWKKITNYEGVEVEISEWDDGLRRSKYLVIKPGDYSRQYWYSQTGSANSGKNESGRRTSNQEWCRVRYLYGDDVRIPECWGSFMYSSHVITGIDGMHYELWFSPSSLSYFKIRNQETGIWYAHDGSANDGKLRTTKEDWCRVIFYHMSGILKSPNECQELNTKWVKAIAGDAGPAAQQAEMSYVRQMMGQAPKKFRDAGIGTVAEGAFEKLAEGSIKNLNYERGAGILKNTGTGVSALKSAGAGLVVGVVVDYGVDAIKKKYGLEAKNANAGGIAAEVVGTAAATTAITTAIMTAAGASFNPVVAGVGFLVAGGVAAGEEIAKASKDTGIRFENGYTNHPRYNRDLNWIGPEVFPHKNPPGTFEWEECAKEGGRCTFNGIRSVRYGAGDNFVERAFVNSVDCGVAGFGSDPAPNILKTCVVQTFPPDRFYFVKQTNNPAIYLQQGKDSYCVVPNMEAMNAFGTIWRDVPTLNLKGTDGGICAFPNGYFRVNGNSTIYYLSGDGISVGTRADQVIGDEACGVPSMDVLGQMGQSNAGVRVVPAGSDLLRNRKDIGVCKPGDWQPISNTANSDVGDGWSLTTTKVSGDDFSIVRMNAKGDGMDPVGGAATRIGGTIAEPWVALKNGAVFRWLESNWVNIPGQTANDVGTGWIISKEATPGGFKIYRFNNSTASWENIPGGAVRIGGTYDSPWIANDAGAVFQYVDNAWQVRPGLAASDVGDGWAISKTEAVPGGSAIYRFDSASSSWKKIAGGATMIGGTAAQPFVSNGNTIFQRICNPKSLCF